MCPFCEAPFDAPPPADSPAATSTEEPEWRREVARRLEVYRARRHQSRSVDLQTLLPFHPGEEHPETVAAAVAPRTIARIRPPERVEIDVSQPEFDFSLVHELPLHPAEPTAPVAALSTRRWAGVLDAAIVFSVFVGFLELFRSMGGQLGLARVDLLVYAITFYLLYALYFSLFTLFSGATPSMQLFGLYLVALDGRFPETRQLVWRSIGYLLSGGTFLLGFLWALWDEDHLTWQDRISQTYVTPAAPEEAFPETGEEQSFLTHKDSSPE